MIAALAICLHLTALGAVQHCVAQPGGAGFTAAKFDGGMLFHEATPELYTGTMAAMASTPGATGAAWARVIMVGPGAVQAREAIRLLDDACYQLADRQDTGRHIAAERANPTGVVSLAELYELGQDWQAADARLRADEKRLGGRWAEDLCK